jgi:hypothetical protein
LTGVAENSFIYAGATSVTNVGDSGAVTITFPATANAAINIAEVPGVTVPVLGATPVTTITATDQYTGTVGWSPADATFAASTIYTATITITPKTGYTLTDVTENFFTVAGATTATNAVNAGVVTAVFPETAATASSSGGSYVGPTTTTIINTNTGSVTGNQLDNAAGVAKDGETITIKSDKTKEVTFPTSGLGSLTGKNNSRHYRNCRRC